MPEQDPGAAPFTGVPVIREPVASPAPPRSFPADPAEVDKPWLGSYPPLVPESYPYPDVPLTRLLDDAAKDFPDSVALDFLGRTLTYRRLLDHVDRFATALHTLGVVRGQRVGIALPNCPQHVIAFFAVLRLGAVVVEIDPWVDERGLAERINATGCRILVVLDPVYATVERLKGKVASVGHVVGTAAADYLTPFGAAMFNWRHRKDRRLVRKIPATEGVLRFTDLVRQHPPTAVQDHVTPAEDLALLAFVGTTEPGPLRAVMLTHRNLLANAFQVRLWVPDVQAGRETILCAVPFWDTFGVTTGLGLGALSAAAMSLVPSFEPDEVLVLIDKRKPTLFPATAEMIEQLSRGSHLRKHDLTSIRASVCNTSSLSDDVINGFEEATGGRLRQALAVVEASAVTHANPIYGKAKTDRVGLPLSDTVCALVDLEDPSSLATPGVQGRLAIHGPQVMKGYWNHPDHTAAVLRDGWLLTALVAATDDDGFYCVTGSVS
ncbi:MAG: AMP-binding protein [Nitriliruptorales bacterium]|nr:AMP-binding protein [Nitriliruptorales bacterium]